MSVIGNGRGAVAAFLAAALLAARAAAAGLVPEPEPDPPGLTAETVRAAQPRLMAGATGAIRPGLPGETELFAVLAAWYPNQRVFLREVEQAAEILTDRFDAGGRIVTLASSIAYPLRHPLATPGNLAAAVEAMAARMNPEDVLIVYLTSHGLPGVLATGDWPVGTPPLPAGSLDAILDRAGAANTVVVISACRSGTFVPVLGAPDRLVITASAADRNSFGCSDTNDWTWFGKAFFDAALRRTRDLRRAFADAAALVAAWEARGGETPSLPQIAAGARIGDALDRLARDAARP